MSPAQLVHAVAVSPRAERAWKLALALLAIAVGYLALTPTPPKVADFGWDKLNHLLAFTALAFSAWLGYSASAGARKIALLGLLAFGGSIEILQFYVPGRSSEWGDLLFDAIGIACGAALAAFVARGASAPAPGQDGLD